TPLRSSTTEFAWRLSEGVHSALILAIIIIDGMLLLTDVCGALFDSGRRLSNCFCCCW
ncbi:unnamed protein product, partial [Ixodes persulcatus]